MSLVVNFSPEGGVSAMYNDKMDLSFLGKRKVERASEILFDEDTGTWSIHVTPAGACGGEHGVTPCATGFDGYEQARRVEVAWFNAARMAGVPPLSPEGLAILDRTVLEEVVGSL